MKKNEVDIRIELDDTTAKVVGPTWKGKSSAPMAAMHYFATPSRLMGRHILPPAIRWVSTTDDAFILERPPDTVKVHTTKGNTYLIPTPWVVWGVRFQGQESSLFSELYCFVRPYPLASMQDELFYASFPFVDEEGLVTGEPIGPTAYQPFETGMVSVLRYQWNKPYEPQREIHHVPAAWSDYASDLDKLFQHLSTLDAEDVLFEDYEPFGTLGDLTKRLEQSEPPTSALEPLAKAIRKGAG